MVTNWIEKLKHYCIGKKFMIKTNYFVIQILQMYRFLYFNKILWGKPKKASRSFYSYIWYFVILEKTKDSGNFRTNHSVSWKEG